MNGLGYQPRYSFGQSPREEENAQPETRVLPRLDKRRHGAVYRAPIHVMWFSAAAAKAGRRRPWLVILEGRLFMRYSTLAPILLASVAFSGLVLAQDGPESALRGTKQF